MVSFGSYPKQMNVPLSPHGPPPIYEQPPSHTPSPSLPPSYGEAASVSSWNQPKPNWFLRSAFKVLGSKKYPYKLGNLIVRSSAENYWRFLQWLRAESKKNPSVLENILILARAKKCNVQTEIIIASEPGKSPGIEISQRERKGRLQCKHTIHFDPQSLSRSKDVIAQKAAFEKGGPLSLGGLEQPAPKKAKPPPQIGYYTSPRGGPHSASLQKSPLSHAHAHASGRHGR